MLKEIEIRNILNIENNKGYKKAKNALVRRKEICEKYNLEIKDIDIQRIERGVTKVNGNIVKSIYPVKYVFRLGENFLC